MKHFRQAVILLTLPCLVYFAVDMAESLIEARLETGGGPVRPRGEAKTDQSGPLDLDGYMVTAERNLFGGGEQLEYFKQKAPPPPPSPAVDLSALGLKLIGTVPSQVGMPGFAIIYAKKGDKQGVYREGGTVEGVEIREILRRQVILAVNGKEVALSMEADTSHAGPAASVYQDVKSTKIDIKREELDEALKNWGESFEGVRLSMVSPGNPSQGYRILGVKRGSILEKLGLLNNDVIMGMNGESLTNVKQVLSFYKNMPGGGKSSLSVRRFGAEEKLDYELK